MAPAREEAEQLCDGGQLEPWLRPAAWGSSPCPTFGMPSLSPIRWSISCRVSSSSLARLTCQWEKSTRKFSMLDLAGRWGENLSIYVTH